MANAYAHTSEIVGDYKVEVGWIFEPPIAGMKNAVEILIAPVTDIEKEMTDSHGHGGADDEHNEHGTMERHEDGMDDSGDHADHEKKMAKKTAGIKGLKGSLEADVTLNNEKTFLRIIESKFRPGVYYGVYSPVGAGFPLVHVVGDIKGTVFEVTFHPERVEDSMPHAMGHESDNRGLLYVFADGKIVIVDPYDAKITKEITTGLENVSWADPILSPDGKHVFVNDRDNAQVIIIDTHTQEIIKRLDVGPRPVHIYNLNHEDEIWTHSDAEGAFYVIDSKTLEVTDIVLAANNVTLGGHGKLLYGESLGVKSAATNTNDNGIHLIDRNTKTAYGFVETCVDGGTHGKAFSSHSNRMYVECGRDGKTVVVDANTDMVVGTIEGSGQIFEVPGKEFVVIVEKSKNQLKVVNTLTNEIDSIIPVGGAPDKIIFYNAAETVYGFTANTMTPDSAVVDFGTMQVVAVIPAGDIARPEGAAFFHRGGVVGDRFFFTPADGDDLVTIIDAEKLELHAQVPIVGPHGLIFVPSH